MIGLVFPPTWYFPCVPADLTIVLGGLRSEGADVLALDLNREGAEVLLGEVHGKLSAGLDEVEGARQVAEAEWEVGQTHGCDFSWPGDLTYDADVGDVSIAAELAGSSRNPFRKRLDLDGLFGCSVVGLAFVHPGQIVGLLGIAIELREGGYTGPIAVFGGFEDVLEPRSLGLSAGHRLFDFVTHVLEGDPVPGLRALSAGSPVPDPTPHVLYPPDFHGLRAPYGTPRTVVDLRMSVGCSWNHCTFCAIPAHHRFRVSDPMQVADAMDRARSEFGDPVFRLRDDLVSPGPLTQLANALQGRGHRFSIRARFGERWTEEILRTAHAAGLTEIWFGLESAVPRVRKSMKKGCPTRAVDTVLAWCAEIGIRVRLLMIAGFPGETEAEFQETVDFLWERRESLEGFSLTPFLLMKDAALATTGTLEMQRDGVPADRAIRWTLPFRYRSGPDAARWRSLVGAAQWRFRTWSRSRGRLGSVFAFSRACRSA